MGGQTDRRTDGRTDGQTDEGHSYNPHPLRGGGLKNGLLSRGETVILTIYANVGVLNADDNLIDKLVIYLSPALPILEKM